MAPFKLDPILLGSTPEDEAECKKIEDILRYKYDQFESAEDEQQRKEVLLKLNHIIIDWIKEVGRQDGRSEDIIQNSGGKIFIFGSFKLGVHSPGTDIDCLCLAPRHIDRQKHFFGILSKQLENHPLVSEISVVKEAYVPIIKMTFDGIDIDMLFARIGEQYVGDNIQNLNDDNILRNCDSETVRSLNGSRVNNLILELVPNIPSFTLTLRCIKLWAKNRGIYSNVLGYLGGIAWAILVARICIMFPDCKPNQLLKYFFEYYLNYNWKADNPVLITELKNDAEKFSFSIEAGLLYQP